MAFNFTIPSVPAKSPSVSPQPGAKHFDIVLGFDFHLLKAPWPGTPCPVTPFAAVIFDPMDYIHITLPAMPVYSSAKGFEISTGQPAGSGIKMGGTVTINGCYRAAADTGLMALPPMIPLGPMLKKVGFKVKPPNPLHFAIPKALFMLNPLAPHDGQIAYGSKTVITQQSNQSALMCNVWSCNEIGEVVLNNPTALFANYATKIIAVLPFGNPVMVGGPFIEKEHTVEDLVNALMIMGIMKGAAAILGRLMKALLKKLNAFLDAHPNIRNAIQSLICTFIGEPVDVASGAMSSTFQGFTLPGPIPFVWEANYYSDSKYDGPLGKNVYHTYDISLIIDEVNELVVLKDASGRGIPFPVLQKGHSFFNPMEKLTLHRSEEDEYNISDANGLQYHFIKETDKEKWHKLRSVTNRNGFAIRFFYNHSLHLEKIIDSTHRIIELLNDDAGRITEIKLPHPDFEGSQFMAIRYTYDAHGRMVTFSDALHHITALEWKDRFITSRKFKDGTVFNFSYDDKGRCYEALGPENLYSYRFEYKDGLTIVENSLKQKSFYYHSKGIVKSIIDSRGGKRTFSYDAFNNLVAQQDPMGNVESYEFDLKGNRTGIQEPGQGNTKTIYNAQNLPAKTTTANGGVWQYEYDIQGNLLQRTNPLGAVTNFEYEDGLLSAVTNETGNKTILLYDDSYNLKKIKFADETSVSYEHDLLGRCTKITGPNGISQHKAYDYLNNIKQITEPDGNIRQIEYNSLGYPAQVSDKHTGVEFSYNFFGDITRRTQAGRTIKLRYDTEGQLINLVNENSEVYSFERDSEGNVIKETGFDGQVHRHEWDLSGRLKTTHRPGNKTTNFDYNTAGQVTLIQYTDGTNEEFDYDAYGNVIKAKNDEAEVIIQRDLLGNILKETQGKNWVSSEYGHFNKRTSIKSSIGANIELEYDDKNGHSKKIRANQWEAEIIRNQIGKETKRRFNGGIELLSEYDKAGKLQQQAIFANGKVNRKRQYIWEAGDRLIGITDTHSGSKHFSHDVYGNLSEIIYGNSSAEYRLPDAVGNLFTSPDKNDFAYGKGGKLLKSNNTFYEYDEEGNLTKKVTNAGEWKYVWNDNGTLQKVLLPDNTAVSFGYDALGRRLWKRYKKTITRWVWDCNVPLHEWKEYDAKDALPDDIITWIFEHDNFAPSAKIKNDKSFTIIGDQLGTPYTMYNDSGEKIWECELNGFGKSKILTGNADQCPFRYQGQYEDVETGLHYNRFRYYNPECGIYISQDPLRTEGGLQLYGYVPDPNAYLDVFGLAKKKKACEVFVRFMSKEEAEASIAANGLVPDNKSNGRKAKWISSKGNERPGTSKKGTVKVEFTTEPGTKEFLESKSVDFDDVDGETDAPNQVIKKSNEPGSYGVGKNVVPQFNSKVKSVKIVK